MDKKELEQKKPEVGYMQPPKDKRFKPGYSGNKKGRPKGSKNTYTLLDEVLSQNIYLKENGKDLKMSKRMAMLMQLVNKGVKGDVKAISTLMPHILNAEVKAEEREKVFDCLNKDDDKIIQLYLAKQKGEK